MIPTPSTCLARSSPGRGRRDCRKSWCSTSRSRRACQRAQISNEDVGEFRLAITPRPNNHLTDLEATPTRSSIVSRLRARPPTRSSVPRPARNWRSCEGWSPISAKSFQLTDGAGFHGDPGYFKTEYEKTLAVTADDVKRVANKYLTGGRVVLSVVPKGKLDQAAKPAESKKVTNDAAAARGGPMSARSIAHRAGIVALVCVLTLDGLRSAGVRSEEDSRSRQGAGPPRSRVDHIETRERCRPDRLGETRPAARLFQHHLHGRFQSVRAA